MEIFYMLQQGHKHLRFSVTDDTLLLTYWHSNTHPPIWWESLNVFYTAILSVHSTPEELRGGLTHLSNSTALKQASGTRTMAPLRKTSHKASPWCLQTTHSRAACEDRGRSPLRAAAAVHNRCTAVVLPRAIPQRHSSRSPSSCWQRLWRTTPLRTPFLKASNWKLP